MVGDVIAAANVNQPKGNFDGPERSFMLDANDQLRSPAAYRNLIVAYRAGAPLRLSDVAQVVDGDDVVDADRVQAAQQVGADHSGGAGDDDSHADPPLPNSSS